MSRYRSERWGDLGVRVREFVGNDIERGKKFGQHIRSSDRGDYFYRYNVGG